MGPGLLEDAQDGTAVKLGLEIFFFEIFVNHLITLNI